MNDAGGNRGPRRAGLLAVTAAVAVLAAACGGGNTSASVAGGSKRYQQALAYSECMRSHGVPNYPDPAANGTIGLTPSMNPSSSRMRAAGNACRHLQAGGLSPAQTQRNLVLELRLVRCMRSHGVPNAPDPGAVATGAPALAKGENRSPRYLAALRICRSLLHVPAK
jgi:hypothetical protein